MNYALFEKFMKVLSSNPQFFDKAISISEHLPSIMH